ncbi:DUF4062 domain-containing protein [Lysobacter korlensis]|uniref:DUF4062 domain-containing protein n=1 Tax=Lysobacter korlensis TaxID=553636 RepID=A0ABV6RRG0_9GAMM
MTNPPQVRYQVFISSTYLDLQEERQAVTSTLLESDAFPTGMELFPATDDDAWTLIKRVIDESDYYLLILAGKYGSVHELEGVGFTEREYDYATSVGKPVMAFLHADPDSLPAAKTEKQEAMQLRLAAFRNKVKAARHVKFWTSPDHLAGQVALTFNKFVKLYPAVGWVRADQAASTDTLRDLAKAHAQLRELEAQLARGAAEPPAGVEELSSGAEQLTIPVWVSGAPKLTDGARGKAQSKWVSIATTWDDILAAISARLLVEAEEAEIRSILVEWMKYNFLDDLTNPLADAAKAGGEGVKRSAVPFSFNVDLKPVEVGTILLQLKALGLITRSERRRSVSDTGIYWSLTPLGEQQAVKVRAIKKGEKRKGHGVSAVPTPN